jgi:hypothetical protein
MPGFSIDLLEDGSNFAWFIKPIVLEIDNNTSTSDDGDIFIDITTGKFFQKTHVVRVEKKD